MHYRNFGENRRNIGDNQRTMQKLVGTREGTEQLGVATIEGTYERRPVKPCDVLNNVHTTNYNTTQCKEVALQSQNVEPSKMSRNVNTHKFKVHDENRSSGGEPNYRNKNAGNTIPRFGNDPQQQMWRIQCSETRDVSGILKAAVSHNSCADQLRHSVQGKISLVLTLRQLSREMLSWRGARISRYNNVQTHFDKRGWEEISAPNRHSHPCGLMTRRANTKRVFGSRLIC